MSISVVAQVPMNSAAVPCPSSQLPYSVRIIIVTIGLTTAIVDIKVPIAIQVYRITMPLMGA